MSIAVARRAVNSSLLNRYSLLVIFGLLLAYLQLLSGFEDDKTGMQRLYFLGLIQVTPFLIGFSLQRFNYVQFIMLNHFVVFTVNRYNEMKLMGQVGNVPEITLLAVDVLVWCSLLIIAGYYFCRYFVFFQFRQSADYQYLSMPIRWYLLVSAYIILVPATIDYIPAGFLIIHLSLVSADLVLLFTATVRGKERIASIIRLSVFLSAFWSFLQTGFLTMIGNYIIFYFLVACLQKKYKHFLVVILIVGFASSIQSVKHQYRNLIRFDPYMSIPDRALVLYQFIHESYFGDQMKGIKEIEEASNEQKLLKGFARSGDASLEWVLEKTPKEVPFWKGETYASIPFMFIPRAIWPEKPSRHFWNKFGKVYGILSPDDVSTSVGVGYLAEAYMNFGYSWMYTLAFLFGIFACLMERISYLILKGHFALTFVVYLLPLMPFGSDLGSMLNSIVIGSCVLLTFRPFFMRMAKNDAYGFHY